VDLGAFGSFGLFLRSILVETFWLSYSGFFVCTLLQSRERAFGGGACSRVWVDPSADSKGSKVSTSINDKRCHKFTCRNVSPDHRQVFLLR